VFIKHPLSFIKSLAHTGLSAIYLRDFLCAQLIFNVYIKTLQPAVIKLYYTYIIKKVKSVLLSLGEVRRYLAERRKCKMPRFYVGTFAS
jgi:hypothetical protein